MQTVTAVITSFRRYYQSCDTVTAAELFSVAYKRLLDKAQIRSAERTFSSIVDGTREYDWNEQDLRVYSVVWYKTATNYWTLTPTSEDELRDQNPAWKDSTDEGDPWAFYITSRVDATSNKTGKLVIGFDIIPDTTTSGGYPKAVCKCERHEAISGATEIPYSLLDHQYFLYSMLHQWSEIEDIQKAPYWYKRMIAEESIQLEHLKNVSVESLESRIMPMKGYFGTPMV